MKVFIGRKTAERAWHLLRRKSSRDTNEETPTYSVSVRNSSVHGGQEGDIAKMLANCEFLEYFRESRIESRHSTEGRPKYDVIERYYVHDIGYRYVENELGFEHFYRELKKRQRWYLLTTKNRPDALVAVIIGYLLGKFF